MVSIGAAYTAGKDYKGVAEAGLDALYGYKDSLVTKVLFKPTVATPPHSFRPREEEALSYFVAGVVPADTGFTISGVAPFTRIRFENADVIFSDDTATAMGTYYFCGVGPDAAKGEEDLGPVEYSGARRPRTSLYLTAWGGGARLTVESRSVLVQ